MGLASVDIADRFAGPDKLPHDHRASNWFVCRAQAIGMRNYDDSSSHDGARPDDSPCTGGPDLLALDGAQVDSSMAR